MTSDLSLRLAGAGLCLILFSATVLFELSRREDRVKDRVRTLQRRYRPVAGTSGSRIEGMVGLVSRLGSLILRSGLLSGKSASDLEQTLAAGGYQPSTAMPIVVGSKLALMVALPVLGWLLAGYADPDAATLKWMAAGAGASIGLMLPNFVIGRLRKRYLLSAERGLPDALDLLVICADAGLPLETALDRVAHEFRDSDPATANELALTSNEMKILPDRRLALKNLGARTGLESLTSLGGTLAQTLQYGTPLTQALRTLSAEMRHTMLMRFEERAARLPVLLTLPMIGLFLPCVIIIVMGPAGVQVFHMVNG